MKRPLETLPPLKAAYHQALQDQLATRWFENPARALKIGLRKASRLPLHCQQADCGRPLLVAATRAEALRLVGLTPALAPLESEVPLYLPRQAPPIDPGLHFAQFAAVWEPLLPDYPIPVKLHNSLLCEMGAGFYLLALHFAPHLTGDQPAALQLDRLTIHHGHEVYSVNVNQSDDEAQNHINRARIAAALMTARKFIKRVTHAYTRAEAVLTQGLNPLIADLERENGAGLRSRPHAARAPEAPLPALPPRKPEWF